MGVNARSWQGWQIPIKTDGAHGAARIKEIDGERLIERFGIGQVAVIAGFQGVAPDNRDRDARPRRLRHQRRGHRRGRQGRPLRYLHRCRRRLHDRSAHRAEGEAAGEGLLRGNAGNGLARRQGAAGRSVELAMVHNVRTFVRSSFEDPDAPGMDDFDNPPGTLICDEDELVEKQNVTGIAYTRDEAQISLRRVQDRPGVSAAFSARWPTPASMST
jgi:aspartate kinase